MTQKEIKKASKKLMSQLDILCERSCKEIVVSKSIHYCRDYFEVISVSIYDKSLQVFTIDIFISNYTKVEEVGDFLQKIEEDITQLK